MTKVKYAYALIRISTSEQNTQSQVENVIQVAQSMGYTIPNSSEYIFKEQISGYDDYYNDRKTIVELKSVLVEKPHKVDAIFCGELSRLTRSSKKVSKYIQEISLNQRIPMYFVDLSIWTINPDDGKDNTAGIQQLIGAGIQAERERETIKKRTVRGRLFQAKLNNYVGHLADGFQVEVTQSSKSIIKDEERACVIQEIFDLYKNGKSTNFIASLLNAKNTPTANAYRQSHPDKFSGYKKTYKSKATKVELERVQSKWSGSSVSHVLSNSWYIGKRTYIDNSSGTEIKLLLTHQAIIADEIWDAVQEIKNNKLLLHSRKPQKHKALLSGLIYCGNCGSKMYSHFTGLNNHYYCSSVEKGQFCGGRGLCKENVEGCIYFLVTNKAYNDTIQGEKTSFSDFFQVDKATLSQITTDINRDKIFIGSLKKEQENSYKAIDTFVDLQGKTSSDMLLQKYSTKIIEMQMSIENNEKKIVALGASIKKKENRLKADKNISHVLKNITKTKDLDTIQDFINAVVERVEIHAVDKNCTVVIVTYTNGKSDQFIYAPRLMKGGFLIIDNNILHFDKTDKLLHSNCYPLYIKDSMILCEKEPISNDDLMPLSPFTAIFTEDFSVAALVHSLRGTYKEIKYERLEDLSDVAIEQKLKYQQWRKRYNTGKPKSISIVIKNANYEEIMKERKRLYHKIEKIKKRKRLTQEDKNTQIDEIRLQLSMLKARINHLPKE